MSIEQRVTTDLTFANGVLVPAGAVINVDTSKVDLSGDTPNLAEVGEAVVAIPVAVAPIGPTGPNPTMPQQVPPGVFQTTAGYAAPGGAMLVAEGAAVLDNDLGTLDEMGPVRHASEATGDATTSAIQPAPAEFFSDDDRKELEEFRKAKAAATSQAEPSTFDADAVIAGTIPDVTGRLDGLTADQLDQVEAAEDDREQPRAGVKSALEAARAKL